MPITFSGTSVSTVFLSNPATQNPATITATGLIDVSGTYAAGLSGVPRLAWTVTNNGTVRNTAPTG